ncbi:MAG: RNA-binding protein [Oscillospiraceae bacterium]|nr:RNA-binding protein [Oscillospiraceae bacterium]
MDRKQQEADRILCAHVQDLVRRGAYRSFTAFLDMRQYTMLRGQLREDCCRFFGGYPDAERGILCLHPEGLPPADEEFPITCLTMTYPESFSLTHRDVLGSLMAQRVERDTVGDILLTPGRVQCFVTGAAAAVGRELTRIGRVGVKVRDDLPAAAEYTRQTREITGTVASLRLDAVLHAASHIRREDCAERIRRGLVMLNYLEVTDPSRMLHEGDVFSLRGTGKFRLDSVGSLSAKGRVHITVVQYV